MAGCDEGPAASVFECNICLDVAKEPVVTMCGHLYCWPCLYQWTERHPSCPVCKDYVDGDRVVPIYCRQGAHAAHEGAQTSVGRGGSVPPRPAGLRLLMREDPVPRARQPAIAYAEAGRTNRGSAWLARMPWGARQRRLISPENQSFLTRLLLLIGSLVILFLLML